jgi:hypothetical protein
MKILIVSALTLLNISLLANADVKKECKLIIDETCGAKDLEGCMKNNKSDKKLEVCLGSLLGDKVGVPKIVMELQSNKLFDPSKASCFTTIAEKCGTMEADECIENKGNAFSQSCRELYAEIKEQQARLDSVGGSCFGESLNTCKEKYDIPTSDYSSFMGGLRSVEFCSSLEVMKKTSCIKPILDSAKARADAITAAAATMAP